MSRRCIVLVGMMGAGKTEVGQLLAEQLGYGFIDTDVLIAESAGKSIAKIFEQDGEEAFRQIERDVIHGLMNEREKVIATGGGAVMDAANRQVLSGLGHTVYLKASPHELYLRVKNDRGRPLLNVKNPEGELARILGERELAYERCDITMDTEMYGVDEVVAELIDELAKRTIETQL
ncbi:MAG: shikimate kinase [Candidatus Sumerlaeota bacterium]|nr:shikimate kinase [Candidatus Sumerlaeota bacterium]